MRALNWTLAAALSLGAVISTAQAEAERIVSIGGSVTEIVYALGQQDRLVARDTTSNYPAAVDDLPDVGYVRALSPEGVLSVNPDLILTIEGAGPPEAVQVLENAGVELVTIPSEYTGAGVLAKIEAVGAALGQEEAATALAAEVKAELDRVAHDVVGMATGPAPKVLFLLSASGGRMMAAGEDSSAAGILKMAGAENALTGFTGYKPVTAEAIIEAAPVAILMMDRSGSHSISDEDLLANPAIATTPVARSKKIIRMDGMHLTGFGPRTPSAVAELAEALHKDE